MPDDTPTGWLDGMQDYGLDHLIHHWEKRRGDAIRVASSSMVISSDAVTVGLGEAASAQIDQPADDTEEDHDEPRIEVPEVVLQATFVEYGKSTDEGMLIRAVTIPFLRLMEEIIRDPEVLTKVTPRQFEEILAGAYRRDGWAEVVLTPASGDRGRDVIATRPEFGQIRIIDQAKRFSPKHKVSANDVRALVGVLSMEQNITKAFVSTTSTFAPSIREEFKNLIPNRLVLRDGVQLNEWLTGTQRN